MKDTHSDFLILDDNYPDKITYDSSTQKMLMVISTQTILVVIVTQKVLPMTALPRQFY